MFRLVITPFINHDFPCVKSNEEFYLDSSDDVCKILDGLSNLSCFYSLVKVSVSSPDYVIEQIQNNINNKNNRI